MVSSRRGLTPPHRVKSISMASFTHDEIELLKTRGNEVSINRSSIVYCTDMVILNGTSYCLKILKNRKSVIFVSIVGRFGWQRAVQKMLISDRRKTRIG